MRYSEGIHGPCGGEGATPEPVAGASGGGPAAENRAYGGLFALDFDGTIRPSGGSVPGEVCDALRLLGEREMLRVIATGRSLYSLFQVIRDDFPVEYVVFSSGAGIIRMADGMVVMSRGFSSSETGRIAEYLLRSSYDFMIHHPIPENHRFFYHHTGRENEDFARRCDLYIDHARRFDPEETERLEASQFLIVEPEGEKVAERVQADLGGSASVVRATSPLDHESSWIEIFPPETDKGNGIRWLAERYGIERGRSGSVGNDYNDLHMLEWTRFAYVVEDAPEQLRESFRVVPACRDAGAAVAVRRWLEEVES